MPSVHRIFAAQIIVIFWLVAMHLVAPGFSATTGRVFDLDGEGNLPTWYSSVLLFSVALIASAVHLGSTRRQGSASLNRRSDGPLSGAAVPRAFWPLFAALYGFLSLDEAAGIHEMSRSLFRVKWVFSYAPFSAMAFFLTASCLTRAGDSARELRLWILGGLVVFAFGGLVCEFTSAALYPLPHTLQQLEIIVEESLEMMGTALVARGCAGELVRIVTRPGSPRFMPELG